MRTPNADAFRRDAWSAVTEAPHPNTGRPAFTVHPCNTANVMKTCGKLTDKYLLAWLCMYAPLVLIGDCDELIKAAPLFANEWNGCD